MDEPSTNGPNGRDAGGRFLPGNSGGPGNPHARAAARLRSAMLAAVSEQDVCEIVGRIVADAKAGDLNAAKLVFAYAIGRPGEVVNPDRIELDAQKLDDERRRLEVFRSLRNEYDNALAEETP